MDPREAARLRTRHEVGVAGQGTSLQEGAGTGVLSEAVRPEVDLPEEGGQ